MFDFVHEFTPDSEYQQVCSKSAAKSLTAPCPEMSSPLILSFPMPLAYAGLDWADHSQAFRKPSVANGPKKKRNTRKRHILQAQRGPERLDQEGWRGQASSSEASPSLTGVETVYRDGSSPFLPLSFSPSLGTLN